MKLGFALFEYFPFGGLQRDMLAIARCCHDLGHTVTVFTREWQGEQPPYVNVEILPVRAVGNHVRDAVFARQALAAAEQARVDRLVGFNKMPGLDFYYAADSCFADKVYQQRSRVYRYTPRARRYLHMEAGVFGREASTQILLISPAEREIYREFYDTDPARLHLLPPGIRRDRIMPEDYAERRDAFRRAQGWTADDRIVLFVGSGFRTKGLDRAVRAIAALPAELRHRSRLLVLGRDKSAPYEKLARKQGVGERVAFAGGVDNVAEYLWAADALLHPAYRENTGTVLLEAMVAGLPVVTTAACGYAPWVTEADMGRVLEEPATAGQIAQALSETLRAEAEQWRERGKIFAAEADIFSMPERAAELLTGAVPGEHARAGA